MKKAIIKWGLAIVVYIANIILVSIKGATLTNSITGWSVAILLAGLLMYIESELE